MHKCQTLYVNVSTEKHGTFYCADCGATWESHMIIAPDQAQSIGRCDSDYDYPSADRPEKGYY